MAEEKRILDVLRWIRAGTPSHPGCIVHDQGSADGFCLHSTQLEARIPEKAASLWQQILAEQYAIRGGIYGICYHVYEERIYGIRYRWAPRSGALISVYDEKLLLGLDKLPDELDPEWMSVQFPAVSKEIWKLVAAYFSELPLLWQLAEP